MLPGSCLLILFGRVVKVGIFQILIILIPCSLFLILPYNIAKISLKYK